LSKPGARSKRRGRLRIGRARELVATAEVLNGRARLRFMDCHGAELREAEILLSSFSEHGEGSAIL
jgi:hypothetical protein